MLFRAPPHSLSYLRPSFLLLLFYLHRPCRSPSHFQILSPPISQTRVFKFLSSLPPFVTAVSSTPFHLPCFLYFMLISLFIFHLPRYCWQPGLFAAPRGLCPFLVRTRHHPHSLPSRILPCFGPEFIESDFLFGKEPSTLGLLSFL